MTIITANTCQKTVWRGFSNYKCGRKAKLVEGVWLCGTHLPSAMKPESAVQRRQREARETDAVIQEEAAQLLEALGVDGAAAYRWSNSQSPRYRRDLLIPFDEVKKILARLGVAR